MTETRKLSYSEADSWPHFYDGIKGGRCNKCELPREAEIHQRVITKLMADAQADIDKALKNG